MAKQPNLVTQAQAFLPGRSATADPRHLDIISRMDEEEAEEKRARKAAIETATDLGLPTEGILGGAAVKATEVIQEAGTAFATENLVGGAINRLIDTAGTTDSERNDTSAGWYNRNKDKLNKDLSVEEQADVADTTSLFEAERRRNRILAEKEDIRRLSAGGVSASLWRGGAMILDLDTLGVIATRGPAAPAYIAATTAGKLAKLRRADKLRTIGTQIGVSASIGVAIESANVALHSQMDTDRIIYSALAHGALGGSIAAYKARKAYRLDRLTRDAIDQHLKNVAAGGIGDSVGAARNPNRAPLGDVPSDAESAIRGAERFEEGVDTAAPVVAGWISKGAKKVAGSKPVVWVSDHLPKNVRDGLKSDFERLNASQSKMAQRLAVTLFEDPTRKVVDGASAAVMERTYQRQILGDVLPAYNATFKKWARQNNASWKDIHVNGKLEDDFGQQVFLEMNSRRIHGKSMDNVDAMVKEAADHVQKGSDRALEIGKGMAGQRAVDGLEDVTGTGYISLNWKASGFARVGKVDGVSRTELEQLFADGYKGALPDLTDAQRLTFSKALVSRQLNKAEGADESLLNLLTSDGRAKLRQALKDNKVPDKEADDLINLLSGTLKEKGKVGLAKHRTEIDMSVTHGDLRIIDFIDTNVNRVVSKSARTMSGRSALARSGITNKIDQESYIQRTLDEQTARHTGLTQPAKEQLDYAKDHYDLAGIAKAQKKFDEAQAQVLKNMESDVDREFLENMFTYFEAGPIAGGVSDTVRRLKMFTNLSLMSQLGLPQLGETGALIAASGIESFIEVSPIMQKLTGKAGLTKQELKALQEEIEPWTGKLGMEHHLIRDDLALDIARRDLGSDESMAALDHWLAKGQRAQGFISGFYAIRSIQQKAAVLSMTNKVAKMMRDGVDEVGGARLADLGLSGRTLDRFKENIEKYAEFSDGGKGFLTKLNMNKWDAQTAQEFGFVMNRHTDQVVQRAMAGEDMMWMHSDFGSLISQYRGFPLLAMRKQAARNIKFGDSAMGGVMAASLATAGIAYAARQLINNRTDNLTPIRIAGGAIAMSNITSSLILPAEPIATIMGLDWANRYGNAGILAMPMLDTVNRTARGVGEVMGGATGHDVDLGRASRAIPIIGGAYGARALFDAMKN